MRILGIETSCDETAAAVVEKRGNKFQLLSNVVASQIDIHRQFGGVVPEVAARSHVEVIMPVIEKALRDAFSGLQSMDNGIRGPKSVINDSQLDLWDQVDSIAVTRGPGLPGALLIGVQTAKTLALVHNKPLYGVDHVEAHMYANFIRENPNAKFQIPKFPLLGLIVSGGHTQLVLWEDHFKYRMLGSTRDDAVGEAFDKVAKMLGLGFPGGPAIAAVAESGDSKKYVFPEAKLDTPYEFSFSGLKTAVLRHLQKALGKDQSFPSHQMPPLLSKSLINDTAASFQKAAVDTLVSKTVRAYREFNPKNVIIAGGVAANSELRKELAAKLPIKIEYAPISLCTDNAAMVGVLGAFMAASKKHRPLDVFEMEHLPSLSMAD